MSKENFVKKINPNYVPETDKTSLYKLVFDKIADIYANKIKKN